jgi:hypothetical protein
MARVLCARNVWLSLFAHEALMRVCLLLSLVYHRATMLTASLRYCYHTDRVFGL